MDLAVRPLHPVFAAELRGVDLREPPAAGLREAVEAAMDRYAVAVLPGQFIDDEQQLRFTRLFGALEVAPEARGKKAEFRPGDRIQHREIFNVSNLDQRGRKLAPDDERWIYSLANRLWHTDSSFRQVSATYSMLSARAVPEDGADTEFVDTRAAYDALSPAMKARLEGLVAEHSIWHSRAQLGGYRPNEAERIARPPAYHPVVRVHPGSGRTHLYIASHISRIVGMDEDEGGALVAELIAHATREGCVYAHKWRLGDLVIWDNRCTMHRATQFDHEAWRRDLRRSTVREAAAAP